MRVLAFVAAALVISAPSLAAPRKPKPAPPPAGPRVALVEAPTDKKVPAATARKLTQLAEKELKAAGFEVLAPAAVAKAHLKARRKLEPCADAAPCLAEVGKTAGAAYVANLSFNPAGKNFGLKFTVVDVEDARVVSNILSFVARTDAATLGEALKKQIARASPLLHEDLAKKKAVAEAKQAEELRLAAEKEAAVKAEAERVVAEKAAAEQAEKDRVAEAKAEKIRLAEETRERLRPREKPPVIKAERELRVMPLVLIGAGAVATGVGVGVFGTQASSAVKDFKAGRDPDAARALAQQKALITDVTAGAGVALMLGGAALWLFGGDDSPAADPVAASVSVVPALNGVALTGSF